MKKIKERIWGLEKIGLSPIYFNSLRLKYALNAIGEVKGKILEVGCGSGAFARAIKKHRPDLQIFGCDVDRKLIQIAGKLNKDVNFYLGDAQKLPFKEKSFDAVLTFDVVEHLKDPSLAFSEIRRILKREGVFHAAIPLEGSLYTVHGLMLLVGLKPKELYAGHIKKFKAGQIERMLQQNGFYHIKCEYSGHIFYQIIDFTYFLIRSIISKKPVHTVEGYLETIPMGAERFLLSLLKFGLAFISYFESVFAKSIPGQIGHFTAVRK